VHYLSERREILQDGLASFFTVLQVVSRDRRHTVLIYENPDELMAVKVRIS
jgi:hypothetical protein